MAIEVNGPEPARPFLLRDLAVIVHVPLVEEVDHLGKRVLNLLLERAHRFALVLLLARHSTPTAQRFS